MKCCGLNGAHRWPTKISRRLLLTGRPIEPRFGGTMFLNPLSGRWSISLIVLVCVQGLTGCTFTDPRLLAANQYHLEAYTAKLNGDNKETLWRNCVQAMESYLADPEAAPDKYNYNLYRKIELTTLSECYAGVGDHEKARVAAEMAAQYERDRQRQIQSNDNSILPSLAVVAATAVVGAAVINATKSSDSSISNALGAAATSGAGVGGATSYGGNSFSAASSGGCESEAQAIAQEMSQFNSGVAGAGTCNTYRDLKARTDNRLIPYLQRCPSADPGGTLLVQLRQKSAMLTQTIASVCR